MMTPDEIEKDRYGQTRVAKIYATYQAMCRAIRAGDVEEAEQHLDRSATPSAPWETDRDRDE